MFAELLLLPVKFFEEPVRQIGPLWYLSALLIVMPLFSYICQSKYRRPIGFAGLILAYVYFCMQDVISAFDPISALLLCASCMFIGMFVFDVVLEIKEKKLKTSKSVCDYNRASLLSLCLLSSDARLYSGKNASYCLCDNANYYAFRHKLYLETKDSVLYVAWKN